MYEAFPRSDYYGSSVTVPDIQKLNFIAFRHSGLGNPRLALWQHSFDRLSDTTFVLYCLLQSRCNLFCFQFSKQELKGKYPTISQETGSQGKVIVQFVVDKDGTISNPEVVRGVDPYLDKEAIRVISSMPKWTPGV